MLANGDIDTPRKAKQVLEFTGADGVMIGRAAQGHPWIFREIAHYLQYGHTAPILKTNEKHSILIRHIKALHNFYGETSGVRIARKHINWYLKTKNDGVPRIKEINRLNSASEQLEALESVLNIAVEPNNSKRESLHNNNLFLISHHRDTENAEHY